MDITQAFILIGFVSYNLYASSRMGSMETRLDALVMQMSASATRQCAAETCAANDTTTTTTTAGNSLRFVSDNVFYAGLSTSVELDYPILGAALQGERDAYATVHPGLISYGAVVVRGSGRLILDGDRSDILFKIDGMYLSLREVLDFGRGIDLAHPPNPTPLAPLSALPAWVAQMCVGTDPQATGSGCAWRRNWGLDACSPPDGTNAQGVCICGGGWQRTGGQVVTRHYPYTNTADADNFLRALAAECCSPDENPTCSSGAAQWLDRTYQCTMEDARPGTLCDLRDRATYLNAYNNCPHADKQACRNYARTLIQQARWSATRDHPFDDGRWYSIALPPNIWSECPLPRLVMGADIYAETRSRDATWECNTDATRFWLVPAQLKDMDHTNSNLNGGMYYISTRLSRENEWYCLAPGPKSPTLLFIRPEAVSWDDSACTAFYLGARKVAETKPLDNLGYDPVTRKVTLASSSVFIYETEPLL